jgi:hypothetical protein
MMKQIRTAGALVALASILPVAAQVGHPAKGSWLGYWGEDSDRHRILLVLDWADREIVGTINPGRNSTSVKQATIDYDTWTMTIEADMPVAGGGTAPFVATGKLDNLGSWVNRTYAGTYRLGEESGTFSLKLN